MGIDNYWSDLEDRLLELVDKGFVKLPSLEQFELENVASAIDHELNGKTFSEGSRSHKNFLDRLGLEKHLTPRLFDIACSRFGYTGEVTNQYHIARRVETGNSKEMYRAHFDSHLFTLVLPIKIPECLGEGTIGDLIYFPNIRENSKSEVTNFMGKAYYKRFASKEGMKTLALTHKQEVDNFRDYKPLLFVGNTTLHTNKQVSIACSSYRLTILAHFFDPSPKYGVGGFLRAIRNR